MNSPGHGNPVPAERRVVRLLPRDFIPPGWDHRTHELVEPNTGDKEAAERRGEPVRVSVWDLVLCAVWQAIRIHGKQKPAYVTVAGEAMSAGGEGVAIVYDKLEPPQCDEPGAVGHAGIEGLARKHGEERKRWRERLTLVASAFAPHT